MSEYINTGAAANDGTGDTLRQAFTAVNRKITELALFGRGAWAPSTAYTVSPRREWVIESDTAYAATENHTSGSTFSADLAAGKWLPMDSAQLIADLAATTGSSNIGYDGGTVQDVLDSCRPMQSYTALRAYTGRATQVRITTPGLHGNFWRDDADTTSADNGGTVIVDATGRRWKRLFDGPLYMSWFQIPVSPANGTTALNAAIAAASAIYTATGAITQLIAPPSVTYRIDTCTLLSGVELVGNNSTIIATTDITGRFTGTDVSFLKMRGFEFYQTAGVNYMPVVEITGGSFLDFEYNKFTGVGYGIRTVGCSHVTYRKNRLSQVGIYPRPSGSGADFASAYNKYGAGLRSETGVNIEFDDNYFENTSQFGGHTLDTTGGAGAFTTYLCDDVTFNGGTAINAPGQGFMSVGAWAGTTVPTDILAGSLDYTLQGKNIRFVAPYARGCNQEGVTAYGCGKVTMSGVISENNAMAAVEAWSSWAVTITGPVCENKVRHSALSPVGAVNIVDSYGVSVANGIIRETRNSGYRVGGSYNVQITGGAVLEYGTDDSADGLYASGVVVLAGSAVTSVSNEVSITGVSFKRTPLVNNAGSDIFVNTTDTSIVVDVAGNKAVGRSVTINSGGLTSVQSESFYSKEAVGFFWGNTARRPVGGIRASRVTDIDSTAKAILPLTSIASAMSGSDAFLCLINGARNDAITQTFADLVLVLASGTPVVVSSTGITSPPARTYTVSGGNLMMSIAANTFSVRVSVLQTGNGSISNA